MLFKSKCVWKDMLCQWVWVSCCLIPQGGNRPRAGISKIAMLTLLTLTKNANRMGKQDSTLWRGSHRFVPTSQSGLNSEKVEPSWASECICVSVSRKHLLKKGCSFLDKEGREGTANPYPSLAQIPGPVGTSKAAIDQGNLTLLGTTFWTPYLVAKHQEDPTGLLKKVGSPKDACAPGSLWWGSMTDTLCHMHLLSPSLP